MDRIYIVMPAYNEADNIERVIDQWYPIVEKIESEGHYATLVIANDGSKDNTLGIIQRCKLSRPLLQVIDKQNSGHGPTVIYLYMWALEQGADYVFQTDSDGQTNPDDFFKMWTRRNEHDFQIGTRFGRKDGLVRVIFSRALSLCIKIISGMTVKDANSPFRLMKAGALAEVVADVPGDFFLSNIAVSVLAAKNGFDVSWIPVSFTPRQGGESMYDLHKLFKLGLRTAKDLRALTTIQSAQECDQHPHQ